MLYTQAQQKTANSHTEFICLKGRKVKEADLYGAFIEVPYTQGAQVRITQPVPRKHHQMAHPRLRLRTSNCSLLLIIYPERMKG